MFYKKIVVKNFAIFTENTCVKVFFNEVPGLLKKDTNTSVSYEYCEILKNTYFEEHLRTFAVSFGL